MDLAREQHINELENLVGEYKAQIPAPETDIQELTKRPALCQGSGMQALREELVNEKQVFEEARRGTSRHRLAPSPWKN